MSTPALVFVHGWGFGPAFWTPLLDALRPGPVRCLNMGFFGTPDTALPDGPVVLVAHSLGVLRTLAAPPADLAGLASLGGFSRFDTPKGPTRAMRRGLGRDAASILAGFYTACALPDAQHPDVSNAAPERLAAGLDDLLELDASERLAALDAPLLALAAEDDAIVPAALSRATFAPDILRMLPDGGHAFPATRAEACARILGPFLESF